MKKLALALLAVLAFAIPVLAQVPQLPANTVFGRLGVGTGPGQAIPFATLRTQLAIPASAIDVTTAPYNAQANCTTDNSTAFTTALAAAAAQGKALYIPGAALCYRFATTITMTELVPIFGDGMDQSVLEYTGAGVGLLIQPASHGSSAAEFRGHFLRDFTIKPSVIGAGTYGIRVQPLVAAGFYAQFVWDHIRVGEFGTYSVYLDNTAGLLSGGFFVGNFRTVQFGNSMIGENIGDTISISNDSKIHGSKALAFSMISGARQLVISDSSITTSAGFSCAPCNGVRLENNHIEIFDTVNFNGANNAQLSFTDSTQITIRKNRIAKVGTGTKPNDTILFLGTTTNAFVDELELAKGNNTHIRSATTTSNITIGSNISVDVAPLVVQLAGATNPGKWIDYTNATAVQDANYQVLCTDRVIHTGAALTASRTITLPASASCPDGLDLEFRDAAGAFGTFGWVITRTGADTIFGQPTVTINKQLASLNLKLIKASGLWVYPVTQVGQGGTGINAGTSGGVPYFSSTTTIASSAALAANGPVIGGGAGVTPATVTAGTNGQVFLGVTGAAPNFATLSQDCTVTNAGVLTCLRTNNVLFTTAATTAIGTSGATIPLLNGVNTWSGANTWSAAGAFTCAAASCSPLSVISTDPDALAGPLLQWYRNSVTPANGDLGGYAQFVGNSSTGVVREFGGLRMSHITVTNTAEDGRFDIITIRAGAAGLRAHIGAGFMVGTTTDPGSGGGNFAGTTAATSATTGNLLNAGGFGNAGAIWAGTYLNTTTNTVNGLPACGAGIKGARTFVNDNATALAFAAVITTGGAIQTPVYCDGTVWRQGANDNMPVHMIRKFA